jgi:hypothetical protein
VIRELSVAVIGDQERGHVGADAHAFGESVKEEAAWSAVSVVTDYDEVEAVFVRVADRRGRGVEIDREVGVELVEICARSTRRQVGLTNRPRRS